MEEDTVKLLRECDAGVKMGIQSIEDVQEQVENEEFFHCLKACKAEHDKLHDEIQKRLDACGDEGKQPPMMATTMSREISMPKPSLMLHRCRSSLLSFFSEEVPSMIR